MKIMHHFWGGFGCTNILQLKILSSVLCTVECIVIIYDKAKEWIVHQNGDYK